MRTPPLAPLPAGGEGMGVGSVCVETTTRKGQRRTVAEKATRTDDPVTRWRTAAEVWSKLKPLARQKRQEPTPAEDRLWQRLRRKQVLGFKFRRQHAIDRFIVDFYCAEVQLVVEVDGPIHKYSPEQDTLREQLITSLDLRMLRFTNDQVLNSLEAVIEEIMEALADPTPQPHPHTPSPRAGRGPGGRVNSAHARKQREGKGVRSPQRGETESTGTPHA